MQTTGAGPRVAAGARISHASLLNWAAVAVWGTGVLDVATGGRMPVAIPAAACALFCVMVIPAISRAAYVPILLALAGLVGLSLQLNSVEPTLQGLVYGTRLGAFMFSVVLLRQMLLDLAPLARARERFAEMAPADRKGAAVMISSAFGSIFSVGTYTVLGPLVRDHPGDDRRAFGKVMACGNALIIMASPFSVGWFYANRLVPVPGPEALIPVMLMLWLVGAVIGAVLHGRLGAATVRGATASIAPLAVPVAVYGVLLAATGKLTALRATEAITVLTPLVYIGFYLARGVADGNAYLPVRMQDAGTRAGRSLLEVLLYASSLACAVAVIQSGIAHPLGDLLTAYPPRMVLATMALLTPLVGVTGFHPAVPTALAAIIGHAILPGGDAAVLLLALVWWTGAALVSFSAVAVWGACTEFGCTVRSVVLGWNLVVVSAVGIAAAVIIGLGLV